MQWKKIQEVRVADYNSSLYGSHMQLPTPLVLGENRVRVFFANRGQEQKSYVFYIDLLYDDAKSQFSVIDAPKGPVLMPGDIGCFDEFGVFPSSIVKHDDCFYMFYIGWVRGFEAPMFYASIGLATSVDGAVFTKCGKAPILARSEHDPCLVTSPHVFRDVDVWRMTYVSGTKWDRNPQGALQSHYHIKSTSSSDLQNWQSTGDISIDYRKNETNIARSTVVKLKDTYHMWFSYVAEGIKQYRIGYATSSDFKNWKRDDKKTTIQLDSELCQKATCYPATFFLNGKYFMLYNGDNFGIDGFCIAIQD